MTQEFHISITPIRADEYLVRTEEVAPGVPLAEEQFVWPTLEWLTQARQLMNDPIVGLLRGDRRFTPPGASAQSGTNSDNAPISNLTTLGQHLYGSLFQGRLRDSWVTAQGIAQHRGEALRLRLGLKGTHLPCLPWEVLNSGINDSYHGSSQHLATGVNVLFSRYLADAGMGGVLPFAMPPKPRQTLNILMAIAAPTDQQQLKLQQETRYLQDELRLKADVLQFAMADRLPDIRVTVLEQPGREELAQALEQGQYQVFHYAGHSDLGHAGGQLYLVNRQTGLSETLSGNDLAGLLLNNDIQLAIFNSCRGSYTANASSQTAAGGGTLAEALVNRGISAVLAMAEQIPDDVALSLTRLFYRNLKQDYPVDLSLSRARQGLLSAYSSDQLYWALPTLYMHPEFDGYLTDGDRTLDNPADSLIRLPNLYSSPLSDAIAAARHASTQPASEVAVQPTDVPPREFDADFDDAPYDEAESYRRVDDSEYISYRVSHGTEAGRYDPDTGEMEIDDTLTQASPTQDFIDQDTPGPHTPINAAAHLATLDANAENDALAMDDDWSRDKAAIDQPITDNSGSQNEAATDQSITASDTSNDSAFDLSTVPDDSIQLNGVVHDSMASLSTTDGQPVAESDGVLATPQEQSGVNDVVGNASTSLASDRSDHQAADFQNHDDYIEPQDAPVLGDNPELPDDFFLSEKYGMGESDNIADVRNLIEELEGLGDEGQAIAATDSPADEDANCAIASDMDAFAAPQEKYANALEHAQPVEQPHDAGDGRNDSRSLNGVSTQGTPVSVVPSHRGMNKPPESSSPEAATLRNGRSPWKKVIWLPLAGVAGAAIVFLGYRLVPEIELPTDPDTVVVAPENVTPSNLDDTSTAKVAEFGIASFEDNRLADGQAAVEELLDRGDLEAANTVLARIPNEVADTPVVNFLQGRLAWQNVHQGDAAFSIQDARDFWQYAAQKSEQPQYYNALGFSLYSEGRMEEAIETWEMALLALGQSGINILPDDTSQSLSSQNGQISVGIPQRPLTNQDALTAYAGIALAMAHLSATSSAEQPYDLLSQAVQIGQVVSQSPKGINPGESDDYWLWTESLTQEWELFKGIHSQ